MENKLFITKAMRSRGDIRELVEFIDVEDADLDYTDFLDGDYRIDCEDAVLLVFVGDYLVQLSDGSYYVIDKEDWHQEVPE